MGQGRRSVEDMVTALKPTPSFWAGRRVLITGHTGFKGGWLAFWLAELGAEITGVSLPPQTPQCVFEAVALKRRLHRHVIHDIRDFAGLSEVMAEARPHFVFHLAAQSLVPRSYAEPVEAFATNVMGAVHVFEAVRTAAPDAGVLNVTSDKCYENPETSHAFAEGDRLGGNDPYSASKAAAELVSHAYRASYFKEAGLATARAGNVIGGGDWAADRLIPDLMRAGDAGVALVIRNPDAIRPWQHVLEPLLGYIALAERLSCDPSSYAQAWNFGPDAGEAASVREVLHSARRLGCQTPWRVEPGAGGREAMTLRLDSSKAADHIGWRPRWSLEQALKRTLDWYAASRAGEDMAAVTAAQIDAYVVANGERQ